MPAEKTSQLSVSVLLLVFIVVFGIVGYVTIEGWDFFDALYMTVITISGVGYGEVHPIGPSGKLFTIFLVLGGLGLTVYVAALAHEQTGIQMEEIPVRASSSLVNVMLKDSGIRQECNLILIAIKSADGDMLFNPSFERTIEAGDTVIAVGEEDNLQRLGKALKA